MNPGFRTGWRSSSGVFLDRREAGRLLADRLQQERVDTGIVVGLARGGVEVAAAVARRLGLPLDALAVRKIGHPLQPEYAIGAVTPDGSVYLRDDTGVPPLEEHLAVERARSDAAGLDRRLHAAHPAVDIAGRPCILVDDGLATGATMAAAVGWARRGGASLVAVAVPVGAPQSVGLMERLADQVVCLEVSGNLGAVGQWYEDFSQVADERVVALLDASRTAGGSREVMIEQGPISLPGDLTVPAGAEAVVIFAHGSGSSRTSPRNRLVAEALNAAGIATLLFDLLSEPEGRDRRRVFDIPLLARRLAGATAWLRAQPDAGGLPLGYFGASTGAAAALWAAAETHQPSAIVSRGGRPDLAGTRLAQVAAPTLLIVGGDDRDVLELNRRAREQMRCESELIVVPGATHLFEEPGALERVSESAIGWFGSHLQARPARASHP